MISSFFPLTFASEEFRLLTGIVLGFLFGFVLERAGFGNARKLAGQFYLNDMTVFKVMFTAILVAMVGLYGLSAVGLADIFFFNETKESITLPGKLSVSPGPAAEEMVKSASLKASRDRKS